MSIIEADVMNRSEITSSMLTEKFRSEKNKLSAESVNLRTSSSMYHHSTDLFCCFIRY